MNQTKSLLPLMIILSLVTLTLFLISLLVGSMGIGLPSAHTTLNKVDPKIYSLILQEIRLPRAILGFTIGASLGLAGATLQGYLRNPLAEPGVMGVSMAAALGAVIAIYTGISLIIPMALPLMAISGSLIVIFLLQLIAGSGGTATLILAGVAISSLCGALTSLVLNLSENPFASLEIVFWLLGSITDRSMAHVWLSGPFVAIGWLLLVASARDLDALTLGEETAVSLGVNLSRTRLLVISGTAFSVGACTAVAGVIGFVGLIVPHLMRPLVGYQPSRLLPTSALAGASLLLCADIMVRLLSFSTELKLGVVTALIGGPFFLFLILKLRQKSMT